MFSVVIIVLCQVEVSAMGQSLVQRNPTECGVPVCDHETLTMRRPWSTSSCCSVAGRGNMDVVYMKI